MKNTTKYQQKHLRQKAKVSEVELNGQQGMREVACLMVIQECSGKQTHSPHASPNNGLERHPHQLSEALDRHALQKQEAFMLFHTI